MKNFLFLFLFLGLYNFSWASFEAQTGSAKTFSLGGCRTVLTGEPSLFVQNPALLGSFDKIGMQISYSQLFELSELSLSEASFVLPYKKFRFGLGASIFGEKDYYQEIILSFGTGYKLPNNISLGANLKYFRVSYSAVYSYFSTLGLDAGLLYEPKKELKIGLTYQNLNQPHLARNYEDIPNLLALGICLAPIKDFSLIFELEKEKNYQMSYHFGQKINITNYFSLRLGLQAQPAQLSFGFGVNWKKMQLDWGYLTHPVLGGSQKVSWGMWLGKK